MEAKIAFEDSLLQQVCRATAPSSPVLLLSEQRAFMAFESHFRRSFRSSLSSGRAAAATFSSRPSYIPSASAKTTVFLRLRSQTRIALFARPARRRTALIVFWPGSDAACEASKHNPRPNSCELSHSCLKDDPQAKLHYNISQGCVTVIASGECLNPPRYG